MTRLTAIDLSPFYRTSIGIDRLFDRITNSIDQTTINYPPYNIVKTGEDQFEIQVAVAGFGQGDIQVVFQDNQVIITGEKSETEEVKHPEYHHQGISARKFVRSFAVSEYMEVLDAVALDGILTVRLARFVPENLKPKSIAISYKS